MNIENEVFTKDENGVSLDINNLNVNCITNSNQLFSVDNEGNITCKSIKSLENKNIEMDFICDKIYPVGSVYISVSNVNPSLLFGGVWEQFATGRTLVGMGKYTDGNGNWLNFDQIEQSVGEYYHKITQDELPDYYLRGLLWNNNLGPITFTDTPDGNAGFSLDYTYGPIQAGRDQYILMKSGGKDKYHYNVQPSIAVFMWKRIS